jgi:hypothetical protein
MTVTHGHIVGPCGMGQLPAQVRVTDGSLAELSQESHARHLLIQFAVASCFVEFMLVHTTK